MKRFAIALQLMMLFLATLQTTLTASDWPMWRFDAGRTAAGTTELPTQLQHSWTIKAPARIQAWDDPLNLDLMPYDRLFEPIVISNRLIVPFSDTDRVCAFDTSNGQ